MKKNRSHKNRCLKTLRPRIPVYKIKPEQTHRSAKDYNRQEEKKKVREILKDLNRV